MEIKTRNISQQHLEYFYGNEEFILIRNRKNLQRYEVNSVFSKYEATLNILLERRRIRNTSQYTFIQYL